MLLELITPEKVVLKDEIDELIINTSKGQIAILPHHANIVTKITPGEAIVKKNGKEQYLAVTGGFLELSNNHISILADYAVRSEEIEVDKALKAQERAKDKLKQKQEQIGERDFAVAQAELRRSLLELQVANKRKKIKI